MNDKIKEVKKPRYKLWFENGGIKAHVAFNCELEEMGHQIARMIVLHGGYPHIVSCKEQEFFVVEYKEPSTTNLKIKFFFYGLLASPFVALLAVAIFGGVK